MANTKSAIKRIRRISRQTVVNKARKSKFKNAIKKMNLLLDSKKKNIKSFLLDQKFVSGIGNIYASEILFYCKINPFKEVKYLTKLDIKKIKYFSKFVLNKAIKKGGSSIRNFRNTSGRNGKYQNEFKVYQRENLNCLKEECFGKIKKKFISKRSTFFCNKCQK